MRKYVLCLMAAAVMATGVTGCGSKTSETEAAVAAEKTVEESQASETEKETKESKAAKEKATEAETTEEETTEETKAEAGSECQTGTWDGLTFTNPWLGVVISLPDGSHNFTKEEMEAVLGASQEVLVNSGNYTDAQMKLAEVVTVYDFMATLPDGQSSIQMIYENLRLSAGNKNMTAAQYLEILAGQLVTLADMQYELEEPVEVEIAGQTFTKMAGSVMGGVMYQDYYCINKDGYMATMTFSYLPDSKSAVEAVVAQMTAAE